MPGFRSVQFSSEFQFVEERSDFENMGNVAHLAVVLQAGDYHQHHELREHE